MNKPVRILHILQRMEAGGTQALLMNLYRNIDREKVQFDFLVHYKEKQFYDDEIKAIIDECYEYGKKALGSNIDLIRAVTAELLERETLEEREVSEIIERVRNLRNESENKEN